MYRENILRLISCEGLGSLLYRERILLLFYGGEMVHHNVFVLDHVKPIQMLKCVGTSDQ